jgi:cyclopropane-fatty-acyl-phospholipid synthase
MSESVSNAPLSGAQFMPNGASSSDSQSLRAGPAGTCPPGHGHLAAATLLERLFKTFEGHLTMQLWNGELLRLGRVAHSNRSTPFTLVIRNPGAISAMVLGFDRLRFAEAYFRGDVDIEGDFFAALGLKDHLDSIRLSWRDRLAVLLPALRLQALKKAWPQAVCRVSPSQGLVVNGHSRNENKAAIHFHYDVSNAFYALWLDPAMVYSCAYFERPETDLAAAQHDKLDHICRKLMLQPGERLLDIGCGWGALLIHAAKRFGVQAHGVTLSQQQLELARERIAQAGLGSRVTVELRDYRDIAGEAIYDKVASVGMFEHVGLKNLPLYFTTVRRLLKPQGLFLNHGITHDVEGWNNTLSTEFINRYIFPDGQLDTVSNILRGMEQAGFEIADVESLRRHYAMTLRRWVARLEQNHEQALHHVDESTYRCWRLYMAACALEFESGEIGVYQLLASKRTTGESALPLTRRHLYPTTPHSEGQTS